MVRFLFRLLATISLAVATILAVLDATRSVAASRLVTTPLQTSWQAALPQSYASFESFLKSSAPPVLWDAVSFSVLAAPGFAVFLVLAFLLYAVGYRRPRRQIGYVSEA